MLRYGNSINFFMYIIIIRNVQVSMPNFKGTFVLKYNGSNKQMTQHFLIMPIVVYKMVSCTQFIIILVVKLMIVHCSDTIVVDDDVKQDQETKLMLTHIHTYIHT